MASERSFRGASLYLETITPQHIGDSMRLKEGQKFRTLPSARFEWLLECRLLAGQQELECGEELSTGRQ